MIKLLDFINKYFNFILFVILIIFLHMAYRFINAVMERDPFAGANLFFILLSGIIIGSCTLFANYMNTKTNIKLKNEDDQKEIINVLNAFNDEIQIFHTYFGELVKDKVEDWNDSKKENYVISVICISCNFNVYKNNANVLRQITNDLLRRRIIKTYMLLENLLSDLNENNKWVHQKAQQVIQLNTEGTTKLNTLQKTLIEAHLKTGTKAIIDGIIELNMKVPLLKYSIIQEIERLKK